MCLRNSLRYFQNVEQGKDAAFVWTDPARWRGFHGENPHTGQVCTCLNIQYSIVLYNHTEYVQTNDGGPNLESKSKSGGGIWPEGRGCGDRDAFCISSHPWVIDGCCCRSPPVLHNEGCFGHGGSRLLTLESWVLCLSSHPSLTDHPWKF